MTAQIFLNLITHGYIKIEDTNLLIFDECHHALGKSHPYRVIMQRFNEVPSGISHFPVYLMFDRSTTARSWPHCIGNQQQDATTKT